MNIDARQLKSKPKKIGKKGDQDVLEVVTKGGLHVVVAQKDKGFETLGTGPHRAVARCIAKKVAPSVVFTDLNKSDHIEEIHFKSVLPKYEALTTGLRRAHGDE